MFSGTELIAASSTSFTKVVPTTLAIGSYKVKVVAYGRSPSGSIVALSSDESDAAFTIGNVVTVPSVTVLSPNGGEFLRVDFLVTPISWEIEYRTEGVNEAALYLNKIYTPEPEGGSGALIGVVPVSSDGVHTYTLNLSDNLNTSSPINQSIAEFIDPGDLFLYEIAIIAETVDGTVIEDASDDYFTVGVPQCDDDVDNDGDSRIDYLDYECQNDNDNDEANY